VDPVRFGRGIRALRRRRGWRQLDLATKAGVTRATVAGIEQGHGERVTYATLERVARPLEARVVCRLDWRGENLDRLLDAQHAALVEQIVVRVGAAGWQSATEVSFNVFGERGSIDVLAYHAATRLVLVVEAKTAIPDVGGMLMTLDRKARLAVGIAKERGWPASSAARMLVVAESRASRQRIAAHRATFEAAFPVRGRDVHRWLGAPRQPASALWFLSNDSYTGVKSGSRVRRRGAKRDSVASSASVTV
jgi:transcriptional regulator with XRE-family HTH domain